jgi:dTDP-4-dehydrorhamnose reductase
MRILVTGASGLLGINLALEAAKLHTVFGLVNHRMLRTEAFTVLKADLLEPGVIEQVLQETQPDWVIHCAALAIVDQCEADPSKARQLNTDVTAKLASLLSRDVTRGGARQAGRLHLPVLPRLLFISTDAVFDGQTGNYSEGDQPHPLSIYAQTKYDGEQAVLSLNSDALIARVNLYGWSISGTRALSEFFFYNLLSKKSIKGFTDVYFCPLLANDLADLLLKMLELNLSGVYHVVSSECTTKYDFAIRLAREFGLEESLVQPVSIKQGGLLAARSPILTLRTDKITRALGYPPPGIADGLKKLHTLYLQGYPEALKGMECH